MKLSTIRLVLCALCAIFAAFNIALPARAGTRPQTPDVAVGAQYDSTHVYVAPDDLDRFVASFEATFGGSSTPQSLLTITPTPSQTIWRAATTPEGLISVFGFKTPIPYPFGSERTGYLVSNFDAGLRAARANGATVVVAPFNDPIGKDAIIEWPGGVYMQLYWHTSAPHYAALATVPDNRIYISPDAADDFIRDYTNFSHGSVVSDEARAPGIEIGRPGETYRRVRMESAFGKITLFVTDGHLPYPYGREITGYEVANLAETLARAKAADVTVLVAPYTSEGRQEAIVQFPGGYIAEIHSPTTT
jgi:hypothetical protein